MAIGWEMYEVLRSEWLKIEGGDPAYTGDYPDMEWVIHPATMADLRLEDSRGEIAPGYLQRVSAERFEFMGVPVREDVDASGFTLRKV